MFSEYKDLLKIFLISNKSALLYSGLVILVLFMPVVGLLKIFRLSTTMPSIFYWYCQCAKTYTTSPWWDFEVIHSFIVGYLWLTWIASKLYSPLQKRERSPCFTSAEMK